MLEEIRKEKRAFGYAFQGILQSFKERHLRFHYAAAIGVTILGFVMELTDLEWVLQIICIAMVLFAEMVNTAVETLCNAVHPERHPAIKATKDLAAGAVLVCSIAALIVGLIIYLPKF